MYKINLPEHKAIQNTHEHGTQAHSKTFQPNTHHATLALDSQKKLPNSCRHQVQAPQGGADYLPGAAQQ